MFCKVNVRLRRGHPSLLSWRVADLRGMTDGEPHTMKLSGDEETKSIIGSYSCPSWCLTVPRNRSSRHKLAKVAFCPRRASISKSCDRPTTAWQKVSRRLSALALTMNFYGNSAPNCGQRISSSNSSCSNTASCLRSTASHRRERNLNNRLSMEGGS